MNINLIFWAAFVAVFCIVFAIDFIITNKRSEAINLKTALMWTGIWISTALIYGLSIYLFYPQGQLKSFEFIAGYLTEYSLSVDNLFVFIMIFSVMGITTENQPKMLKIGILLSIFLRILFIIFGVELIHHFHFFIYIFGALLLYTAYKMLFMEDSEIEPEKNIFYKTVSKYYPIDYNQKSFKFFSSIKGKKHVTTLFLIFLLIGTTDIVFAIDSIPAIIGITQDTFIVITSNVFAVLGLVSLFFALEGIIHMFRYLKNGVAVILFFVGAKMLISGLYQVSITASLAFIILTLVVSIISSVLVKKPEAELLKVNQDK